MEQWYAIYWKEAGEGHEAGELYSTATILSDPMPSEFGVVEIAQQPDDNFKWNKDTLSLEPVT